MEYSYKWSPSFCNPYISSGVSLTADQEKLLSQKKKEKKEKLLHLLKNKKKNQSHWPEKDGSATMHWFRLRMMILDIKSLSLLFHLLLYARA